jgi:hypothetical protein
MEATKSHWAAKKGRLSGPLRTAVFPHWVVKPRWLDIIFYIQPALLYPAVSCRTLLLIPAPFPFDTLSRKIGGDSISDGSENRYAQYFPVFLSYL